MPQRSATFSRRSDRPPLGVKIAGLQVSDRAFQRFYSVSQHTQRAVAVITQPATMLARRVIVVEAQQLVCTRAEITGGPERRRTRIASCSFGMGFALACLLLAFLALWAPVFVPTRVCGLIALEEFLRKRFCLTALATSSGSGHQILTLELPPETPKFPHGVRPTGPLTHPELQLRGSNIISSIRSTNELTDRTASG